MAKTNKGTDKVKEVKAPATTIAIADIINELPDKVTPSVLDKAFQLNDGGKTIRRHLRKHFAEQHNHRDNWNFDKLDPTFANILTYFCNMYKYQKVDA